MATRKAAAHPSPAALAASFDPRVDAYIAKAAPFAQPILEHIRQLVHDTLPGVEEAIKWSMPFFIYRGLILGNMAAFKAHCSFGIWSEDVQRLMSDGAGKTPDGMGSFGKIASLDELPGKAALKKVLLQAAGKIETGERSKAWTRAPKSARPEAEIPTALAKALAADKTAGENFAAMSPSCRREYCEWIGEAKREETRDKRVAQALEWIGEGKSRHWKYQSCQAGAAARSAE